MTLCLNIATLTHLRLIVLRWLRKQTQQYQPLSDACLSPSADYLLPLMHRTHRATVVRSRQEKFLASNVGQMQRSSIRRFGLKLLQSAACSVATIILTAYAFAAPTVTVSVGGQSYHVTYTVPSTSYNASTALIQSQPWWGNSSRAQSFATAVGSSLGQPYQGFAGPLFAYATSQGFLDIWISIFGSIGPNGSASFNDYPYATATLASSPSAPTTESSTPVTSDIVAGTSFGLSGIGVTANPILAGGTLVLNRGDSSSVSIAITSAGGTIQAPSSGSAVLSGVFSGSGGLTFTTSAGVATGGTGSTIVLSGANTYSGGTTVSGGTLVVRAPHPLGQAMCS
jgi:autotransporter-associated beta strand protein